MNQNRVFAGLCSMVAGATVWAQPGADLDWRMLESRHLRDHVQLTSRDAFIKAGEAYFNPDATRIIFQAIPVPPEGEEPALHYLMYTAALVRDERGLPVGIEDVTLLSAEGSANTCGWFHPTDPERVLFGSTLVPPSADNVPGYQRGTGRYTWQFPTEMEIVVSSPDAGVDPRPMFDRPGYTAEGSWSPDGRHVLYAQVDDEKSKEMGRPDADLYVYDTVSKTHAAVVKADGYDGGPFFSPNGKWICYRSDRRGDNLLQLFIAELAFDEAGRITGIEREVQLTNNEHVNWAPYWHPSGRYLVYTTSEVGHYNYELFAIPALDARGEPVEDAVPYRVTHATGFDGLSVFSEEGRLMMWTAQRGEMGEGDDRSTSQLWIATVDSVAMQDVAYGRGRPARSGPR